MKRAIKQWWAAFVVALSWMGAAFGADIQYVADNVGGEYNGIGYGIDGTISVSTPSSGTVIKYAESSTGPWQDEPIKYKNVCTDKPIFFQITAQGYTPVIDSRTVTITPKTLTEDHVWLVLPTEDYVYDGAAKTPEVACGDSNPSIITCDDFDVSFANNVNAGTATATFTGKGNYTGTVTEDFEINKADNEWMTEPAIADWTYGQAPSDPVSAAKSGTATVIYGASGSSRPTLPGDYVATFTVPESQNYKALTKDVPFTISPATINYVADGSTGEYCGTGYGISVTVSTPSSGMTVKYSETDSGPWQEESIIYKDVCTDKPIYFQITAEGYTTVVDSRKVTVTPKSLTEEHVWLVLPTEDYVYDGAAKTPEVACGDSNPSIITRGDFDVSFANNVNAGTATATFTGKGNYTGIVTEDFEIKKAKINGGEEPGDGNAPVGGLSKFDVTVVYDGEEHTADAAAILAAWQSVNPNVSIGYALWESSVDWTAEPEQFVDVCETSIWYKVTLANHEDFFKEVKITILPPPTKDVVFDAIGGVFDSGCSIVTQECDGVYGTFPVATREGYAFDGWYLGVTNGARKAAVGASLLADDDHTLFAKWSIDETLMPGGASIFVWEAIDANTVRIKGFKDAAQKVSTLVLPDMIDGRFVTEIAAGAFANSKSGMTKLVLPVFCTKIGDKAFNAVASLKEIVFADVRDWNAPSNKANLSIGRYAFTGTGVSSLTLPASVSAIGDYAFANCKSLLSLTILGRPTVGLMPLRRAGMNTGGVQVHLDPVLANDGAYMETLKQECGNVTVRADAVVTRMTLSSLAMSVSEIELSVSVEKAASWGIVDVLRIKVAYRESLSDAPTMLDPSSVTENADGSLTVKVVAPKGNSGFFQVVLENK